MLLSRVAVESVIMQTFVNGNMALNISSYLLA
jgi:hypothetical protein